MKKAEEQKTIDIDTIWLQASFYTHLPKTKF